MKRKERKEGGNEGAPEDEIVREDMDLDVNIEDIEFPMKRKEFRKADKLQQNWQRRNQSSLKKSA